VREKRAIYAETFDSKQGKPTGSETAYIRKRADRGHVNWCIPIYGKYEIYVIFDNLPSRNGSQRYVRPMNFFPLKDSHCSLRKSREPGGQG
jgi:hypothetical protein